MTRKEAIENIKEMTHAYFIDEPYFTALAIAVDALAQEERKQGKWKPIEWSGRFYKCNQCGNMLDFGGVNVGREDANFCPNCGADIRGGERE